MLIYGRNAVIEAIKEGGVHRVWAAVGVERRLLKILSALGVHPLMVPRIELDQMVKTAHHQGVVAVLESPMFQDPEVPFALAQQRGEPLLLVLLDGVTDPGNYGAIIRSAEALGAHGVVSETHRSAPLSAVTIKTSVGAAHHLPLVQVVNLPRQIEWLKSRGIWIYGMASEVDHPIWALDFQRPVAVVLGSEGKGLRRLVREHCDELGRIPLYGQIGSLNVASALAVVLYQAARWREG